LASECFTSARPALALSAVSRRFGAIRAVDGVSLQVQQGERRALIGPNGAGKTTLFHVISGVLSPSAGSVEMFGHTVTHMPTHRRVALGMARTFQLTTLFGRLTVEDNIALGVHGLTRAKLSMLRPRSSFVHLQAEVTRLLHDWQLIDKRHLPVNALSYGEQRTLEIILAIAQKPRLVLLDEPTAGLSPAETAATAAIIKALPRDIAIVLIEHDLDVVFDLCDSITVLHLGRELVTGTPEAVRDNPVVQDVYLGGVPA
jgi:branched-chain amino acid transport system ATP-binding protein